jgi:hypothetical protein
MITTDKIEHNLISFSTSNVISWIIYTEQRQAPADSNTARIIGDYVISQD